MIFKNGILFWRHNGLYTAIFLPFGKERISVRRGEQSLAPVTNI